MPDFQGGLVIRSGSTVKEVVCDVWYVVCDVAMW